MVKQMKTSALLFVLSLTALASCRYDMQDQPKYLAYRGSESFADSLSSRTLVEGTVPRGYLREDAEMFTGKLANGATATTVSASAPGDSSGAKTSASTSEVNTFPFPITREILDRGEERFNIYCSPC